MRFAAIFLSLFLSLFLSFSIIWLTGCQPEAPESSTSIPLSRILADNNSSAGQGYARAIEPHPFSFPRDHNAHPDFKTEWWYFTGNLTSAGGKRFGYQLTFFRIALSAETPQRKSHWAARDIWMAHAAISDFEAQQHFPYQRIARGALGLAGNATDPSRIWLDDWQIERHREKEGWRLRVATAQQDFGLDLLLEAVKPVTLQGNEGLSQKGQAPGNASYYYSIPRLETQGSLRLNGVEHQVSGLSWFDREWGTSTLDDAQEGWDWFALQLDSGDDLMFYRLRRSDGRDDPHSGGSWIDRDGSQLRLTNANTRLEPLDYWRGPSGTDYPIRWLLTFKDRQQQLLVEAAFADQLMDLSVVYWEGAVIVRDPQSQAILGRGYLEMAGYQ